jgi:hypothetical protein
MTCPHFQPRSLWEPNLCKSWMPAGQDRRGDPYPAYCSHREVVTGQCESMGFKQEPRNDSDDDGEIE